MSSGLFLTPGVPVCLPYLDVVIKDYYFEVYSRLRVPRFSLLCAPWQKTRPNSKRRPFTLFCFVRFFKFFLCSCVLSLAGRESSCPPFAGVYAAVRGSPSPPFAGVHATVRGSSRRHSQEFTPPFAAQPSRRSREFTPPFAAQPARRSQEMTPPSTANPSPPACLWLPLTQCPPARRWLKPAGLPLTHARWPPFVGKANPPLPQYHAVHGTSRRRPWGKPTHRPRLPLVFRSRGKATRRPWLTRPAAGWGSLQPAGPCRWVVKPAGCCRYCQACRLWSRQPVAAVVTSQPAVAVYWPDCDPRSF